MNGILNHFTEPATIDQATAAYPASVIGVLIPERKDLPEEFQREWTTNPYCRLASKWFFEGADELNFKEGIDPKKAFLHLRAALGSWEPKHEHKIGAVGWLLSLWYAEELED